MHRENLIVLLKNVFEKFFCKIDGSFLGCNLTKYSIFSIGNDLIWYDDPQKYGNILMWYSNIVYIPDGIEPTIQVSLLNTIRK